MGCPHCSHLVKTESIGPTPLSVSGALREYSLRLLSQFLMPTSSLHDPGERLAHLAQPSAGPPSPAFLDEPHELASDDDSVGLLCGLDGSPCRTDSEAKCHRRLGPGPHTPQKLYGAGRKGVAHPRNPGHGDAVHEPGRHLSDARDAPVGRGRRNKRAEGDAGRCCQLCEPARLVHGEVGDHEPRDSGFSCLLQELLDPAREDYVIVEQEDYWHPPRERRGEFQAVVEVGPVSEGARRRLLDRRPVGERVGEGNPDLQHIGTRLQVGLPDLPGPFERRIAAGQVWHERGLALPESTPYTAAVQEDTSPEKVEGEGSGPDTISASSEPMPSAFAATSTSLSPRPETLMTMFFSRRSRWRAPSRGPGLFLPDASTSGAH